MTPTVEILGKTYTLRSLDPMPIDLRIRRASVDLALAQNVRDGTIALEVLYGLQLAVLGLLAEHLSDVTWRPQVAAYSEALQRDLLGRCPEAERDRLERDLAAAAQVAWAHWQGVRRPRSATKEGAASAEDFSARKPEHTQ